jgi:hypothetical protein
VPEQKPRDYKLIAWRSRGDVVAALRFLAENERPAGGESNFNSAHLHQLADEMEAIVVGRALFHGIIAGQEVMPPEYRIPHGQIHKAVKNIVVNELKIDVSAVKKLVQEAVGDVIAGEVKKFLVNSNVEQRVLAAAASHAKARMDAGDSIRPLIDKAIAEAVKAEVDERLAIRILPAAAVKGTEGW